MKGTIVIPCLDSHEVVRRQLLWLDSWMKPFSKEWDLNIVDDGSSPEISITSPTNFIARIIHIPPHPEKWTQPRARNVGAKAAKTSKFIFFIEIDHILTPEALDNASHFDGDMLNFIRKTGILNSEGKLLTSETDLLQFGAYKSELTPRHRQGSVSVSSFTNRLIRKSVHEMIGEFNENMMGWYAPEDRDYQRRYNEHVHNRKCKPPKTSQSVIYVFPNPKANRQKLFHSLRQNKSTNPQDL